MSMTETGTGGVGAVMSLPHFNRQVSVTVSADIVWASFRKTV